ncbi:MAG: ribosomal-processing cysteine protease Prp, partial [Clostridia bacterium]|nr:ribosomal-processing cysteine protease Prp [Clostridia bacterium]
IISLVADGHTDYGVQGEDIVCASLSSIIQTAVLGLLKIVGINLKMEMHDAYLSFELPLDLSEKDRHDADIILETMLCGIADLNEGYSDFVDLEVK